MKNLVVVVSRGQSENPAKRQLEQSIADGLRSHDSIEVLVVPHLYDLRPDGPQLSQLRSVSGDMVVLSWLYSRAAHWMLNRQGVRGQVGPIELTYGDDADDEVEDDEADAAEHEKPRVADELELPKRSIYCLDLRASSDPHDFLGEVQRIAKDAETTDLLGWIKGDPSPEAMARYLHPTANEPGDSDSNGNSQSDDDSPQGARRWYPVIDFSRCTNCMECIDFCLFGVYGVDQQETILVEQPDNCRKGCPACSRVCPENAIIFPQHKSPAIAGAAVATEGLKIDLSKLFGAPDGKEDAIEVAARERDEQLLLAGREAVGLSVGIPKRQEDQSTREKDDLDDLIDELDEMDL